MQSDITLHTASGTAFQAHVAEPGNGTFPALICIEEIWGLNENIKSIAKRLSEQGYVVLAPELLGESGVLEKIDMSVHAQMRSEDEATRTAAQAKMRAATAPLASPEFGKSAMQKLAACMEYLLSHPTVNGQVGVVGFCFGGTYAFHLAAQDARIRAAVPFYGQPPRDEEIPSITCPILAFYGEEDSNLMGTLPQLEEKMHNEKKDFTAVVYPGAGHAFFNEHNKVAYREEPARDAWEKTLTFLRAHLA